MPERESSEIASDLWEVTGEPGMRFLYVSGKSAGKEGEVLAFEPEIDPQERVVLLTNGLVGTMRTSELESHLRGERASEREVKK